MRVFVTGASGWVGSAVVPELLEAGHQVVGLARSDASAEAIAAAGAEVLRGDLNDLDSLRTGAAESDGVIHLAYNHDFTNFAEAAQTDLQAIETIGEVLAGSDRPLAIASGTAGLPQGRVGTERDTAADPNSAASPRARSEITALSLAERGVRSASVRLSPTVHGDGDHGFIPRIIQADRGAGAAFYVGDGSNRWPAVHRFDAARLFRLAIEQAPAGSVLHAVDDEGVAFREIAEVIGRHLDVPAFSISAEEAAERLGFIGAFMGADVPASSALTRELLGWEPTHPGLIEDLEQGHYFQAARAAA